jgi:cytochrome c-type biogenesis protein CcmH/NrfF
MFLAAAIGAILMFAAVLLLGFFLIWILPLIVTLIAVVVVIPIARRIFTGNK